MKKLTLTLTLALSVTLLSACGGGGGGTTAVVNPPAVESTDIAQSVSAWVTFLSTLINGTAENSDPIEVTPLSVATDDTAEPSLLK